MNRFAFVSLLLSFAPFVFADDSEKNYNKYWAAHGICASIAWAILVPLAIGSSMLRRELVKCGFSEGFWFQLHRALNLTAAILTIIAFAIAVFVIREQDGEAHFKEETHFMVGLVIFLVTLLQAMYALLRPSHLPHEEEKKGSVKNTDEEETETKDMDSTKEESTDKESKESAAAGEKSLHRIGWEIKHRFIGVGLLATAWWQLHSGWELYTRETEGEDLGAIFLGVAGGISGIIVVVHVVQKMRAHV
jgi:uncharacterized membrane protein YidH (DUF202 family)